MVKFQTFVTLLSLAECLAVAFVIFVRCSYDPDVHKCEDLHSKSLSFLLDWRWLKTLSAVFLGGVAFLNVLFAFYLLYPQYSYSLWTEQWYIWVLRVLHAVGYGAVAFIGVFDINDYSDLHMTGAFWLFLLLTLEANALLFIPHPHNQFNIQSVVRGDTTGWDLVYFSIQILHAQLCWIFAILFVHTDIGAYEWVSIWLIILYVNWFSRDHWDDNILVMVEINAKQSNKQQLVRTTLIGSLRF